ncbi:tyrosine-type recombinase/integrase [Novosphingobium sp. SG707]|uniref:tyrosine-type recombinase/integrase n=1 Tax=Novosphingobium sp. SG707 TaxID=2586996 RepID=UPI00144884F3|nr:tyrosine-type recombinase/integrase [Novosphingobium sp. SG707]NKJ02781.1 integrase [Novosphingobium sp. SG707]
MTKRRWLPPNVTRYQDKTGRWRYRYRKAGKATYSFRAAPGTPEFLAEYEAAKAGQPVGADRVAPGSVDALCAAYYRSPRWQSMQASTQKTYRSIIERWRKVHGDKPFARLEPRHVDAWLAAMSDRPTAANNLRKALMRLFRYAVRMGWIARNPISPTEPYRINSEGIHAWTEDEIAAFQAKWPMGTRERLALELMLWTGLRKSDVIRLGPAQRQGDRFHLRHTKNKSDTILPVSPDIERAITALDPAYAGGETYLITEFGKPFTSAGFGNWFRDRCDMAGLKGCSAHGLRKALSRRIAEAGGTSNQGRAVTGHKSDRMFAHYSQSADKAALADTILANLSEKFAKSNRQTHEN